MSPRDLLEFDGKPGTSKTDVIASLVVLLMAVVILYTLIMVTARAIEAETDPAEPACMQAIADGYYTSELYGQCLDDWREAAR